MLTYGTGAIATHRPDHVDQGSSNLSTVQMALPFDWQTNLPVPGGHCRIEI